ncbi:hypothetical protein [Nonomuraea insulae]|uniref:Uncharacterized protein n=1 Tax=Nonomuraea insulae TaxID=1616787 RepID=A0ABW1CRU9_9ACTN
MRPYLVSLDPGATAVEPGGTVTTTLTVQAIGEGGALTWTAKPPAGITVTPASGTVDVPGNGQAKVQVTLAVGAGMATGFTTVPVEVAGVSAAVKLNVAARGTIEWHHNNAGIGDDTEAGLANFDGIGWSYSAQALAAAGARPGGTVTWKGHTFAWPGREPGEWDNVQAGGQTVDLTAPAGAKALALLGAGASGDIETNLTITYTDGSTQETKVGFSSGWTRPNRSRA